MLSPEDLRGIADTMYSKLDNMDTGKVATVWPMNAKTLRKLLRKKGLV